MTADANTYSAAVTFAPWALWPCFPPPPSLDAWSAAEQHISEGLALASAARQYPAMLAMAAAMPQLRPPPGLEPMALGGHDAPQPLPTLLGPKWKRPLLKSMSSMSTACSELADPVEPEQYHQRSASSSKLPTERIAKCKEVLDAIKQGGANCELELLDPALLAHLPALARTEPGASFLVQRLAAAPAAAVGAVAGAALAELPALACDAHGTTVVLELINRPEQCLVLAARLRGSVLKLTKDKHGCWVLQRALETAPSELQAALAAELKGKVVACSQHMHGNFVLQKCVELLPPSAVSFVVAELAASAAEVAEHVYGCRVLQRLIEHCSHERQLSDLLASLLDCKERLAKLLMDAYGNNVMRALMQYGSAEHACRIMEFLSSDVVTFAKNRHSSLVLERCLEVSSGDRSTELCGARVDLVAALIGGEGPPALGQIMLDRFGNYIAQRVIECSQGSEQERLRQLLAAAAPKLRRSPNGKHILAAAQRKFGTKVQKLVQRPGRGEGR